MDDNLKNIDLDNEEFQNVLQLIRFTRRSVFMTGKAGTGKSTFMRYICQNTRKRHVVLAPTGIAAANVGGMTLHSFFKIPLKPIVPDDPEFALSRLKKRMKYSKPLRRLIEELELIIIDEISMVRADILDFIDKILRVYSKNMREPFGGKQMLFVGDVFQLEPVVTSDMRDILSRFYPRPFFFAARVFDNFSIVPIELRKVYRQTDAEFVSMLDRLRSGRVSPSDLNVINSRIDVQEESSDAPTSAGGFSMTLAARRETADSINESRLRELPTKEITFYGKTTGDFPESSFPTQLELTLKEGAQVVFVRNDRDRRWVNGSIGIVVRADDDEVVVRLEDGNLHTVDQEVWENLKYEFNETDATVKEVVLGTFTQYPLRLAWALTIHKSQGLTFNNVIIDIGRGAFSGGQSYVALSRCTSLGGIRLTAPFRESDFFVSPAIVRFASQFNDTQLINAALADSRADRLYDEAGKAFANGDYSLAVENFCEAVCLRNDLSRPEVRRLLLAKLSSLTKLGKETERLAAIIDDDNIKFRQIADEYVKLGRFCIEDGEFTPAVANFEKALTLVPNHAAAVLELAKVWFDSGKKKEAVARLEDYLTTDSTNVDIMLKLGDFYYRMRRSDEALDTLLEAFVLSDRKSVFACRLLADIYAERGDEINAARFRALVQRLTAAKRKN